MNLLKYTVKYIEHKTKIIRKLIVSDKSFHSKRYELVFNQIPNLKTPRTLNEKICYRLIYDHNEIYTLLADKLKVREYVIKRSPELKMARLINIYESASDIDLSKLPEKFVLKCNHDSGSTIICKDKLTFDIKSSKRKLKLALNKNMYYSTREWQYKNIIPFIICEEYIELFKNRQRSNTPEMLRIHCFDGTAHFTEADFTDEFGSEYVNIYDKNWNLLPFNVEYPNHFEDIKEPTLFSKAIVCAEEISKGIDYCRVDLMLLEESIYFSEVTLSPSRGKIKIIPREWDLRLGSLWKQNITKL